MNVYEALETDPKKELDGIEVKVGDATLKVARAGGANRKFQSVLRELIRGLRPDDEEGNERALAKAYAQCVVKSWENVDDRDGTPLECTPENVERVLLDLPVLRDAITLATQNFENYLVVEREEMGKD